jgi:hypothetical protein
MVGMARKYKTVKEYAIKLLLHPVTLDTGLGTRHIGYSYLQILSKIRQRFPIVIYGGPHKGKPLRMTVKDLQKLACSVNQDDPTARLPVRPRHKKRRRKKRA